MVPSKIIISIYKKTDDVKRIILGKNIFIFLFVLYSATLILCGNILNPFIINKFVTRTTTEDSIRVVDDAILISTVPSSMQIVNDKTNQVRPYSFMPSEGEIFDVKEKSVNQTSTGVDISFLLTKKNGDTKTISGTVQVSGLSSDGTVIYDSNQESFKFKVGRYTSIKIEDQALHSRIKYYIATIVYQDQKYNFLIN